MEIHKNKNLIMTELKLMIDGLEKTYNIPTTWDDITIQTYKKIVNIPSEVKGVFLSIELAIRLIGLDRDTIEELPIEEFNKILEQMTFINEELKAELAESIEVGGETFYFKKDFSKLTTGEVASIDLILQSAEGKWYDVIEKLLCIFLRKKVGDELEKFKSEMMDRAELFKDLKIKDVQPIFFYFSSGENGSPEAMKESLENQPKRKKNEIQD
jgi:hypothetical protein